MVVVVILVILFSAVVCAFMLLHINKLERKIETQQKELSKLSDKEKEFYKNEKELSINLENKSKECEETLLRLVQLRKDYDLLLKNKSSELNQEFEKLMKEIKEERVN